MKRTLLTGLSIVGLGLILAPSIGYAQKEKAQGPSYSGSFTVPGGAKFTVQPPVVTVESARYKVDFLDASVRQIVDKKTGQVYCQPGEMKAGGRAQLFLKDFRPGQPERTFVHIPRQADGPAPGVVQKLTKLVPSEFRSAAGAVASINPDGIVIVTGACQKDDTYTLKVAMPAGIDAKGLTLEPLSDASLPAHGPGRAFNGNFVVSKFSVSYGAAGAAATPNVVKFTAARADHEQQGREVAGAIDDSPETGWSVGGEAGKNHQATFMIDPGTRIPAGATLAITIQHNSPWAEHTIGKFKLSVMSEVQQDSSEPAAAEPRIHVKKLPRGVEYTVTGLDCPGDANTKRYYNDAMIGMRIEFDEKTGDLVMGSVGRAGRPQQFGVNDEGIFGLGFQVGPFDKDIRYIHPVGGLTPVTHGGGWWPMEWPLCLTVYQAPGGECVSIWADDEKLDWGKRFWAHDGIMDYHTINGDAPWRTTSMEAPVWRLNLFDSWVPAASRYSEVMERTLDVKPLSKREPLWAGKIRLVAHQVWGGPATYKKSFVDKGIPVESIMEWHTQGWLAGYGTEIMSPKRGEWFPNYPFEQAQRYEGYWNYGAVVKELQDFGVACFPYTCQFVCMSEPFRTDSKVLRAPDMDFQCGGRMWWLLYANMTEDIVKRYGVRGIYDDCSWIGPAYDPRGKVDGLTVWQAHVWGRKYLRDRLLPVAFMGERQHEITIVSDLLALMWIGGEVHPINAYLLGRYTLRWNQAEEMQQGTWLKGGLGNSYELHNSLDASESLGCIPMNSSGIFLNDVMRQETALIQKRIYFWGQQMLTMYFPEKFDPGVVSYLRGKDGAEYRIRNDGGMGLVRVNAGKNQVVWWRTRGVPAFEAPGAAIEGWVAYKGDTIVGMNPGVRYAVLEDNERPAVTISELPAGVFLANSRMGKGYWAVVLGGQGMPGAVEVSVASGGKPVKFVGAEVVGMPTADGVYKVKVGASGTFAAYWDFAPKALGALPVKLGLASSRPEVIGAAGVVILTFEQAKEAAAGAGADLVWDCWFPSYLRQADYLVKLPTEIASLETVVSGTPGQVRMRVNGKVVADVQHGGGNTTLKASLADYAGETVLITFEFNMTGKVMIAAPQLVSSL